ncbi:MAG: radical SAM protein [Deltaproteobacteria bacterium]|nr:radical SAM protein [Deltaproteobacteria bacterium]
MNSARALPTRALPRRLHLEVTNGCNSLCTTCVRTRAPEPTVELAPELVERLLAQLPELESAALQVNGEPLLYRPLPWLVRELVRRHVHVELNTNAITLEGEMARSLVDAQLPQINISLDGATASTYARIRGVDAFERVLRNIRHVLRLRGAAPAPRVVLWVTLSRQNIAELDSLFDLAVQLGVDGVYLQRLVFFGYGHARAADSLHGRLTRGQSLSVARATVRARAAGLDVAASGGHAPDAMHRGLAPDAEPYRACRRPSESAVVMANGDVVPCCIATFVAPRDAITMGNLKRQSLAEIWSGERYREWREGLRRGEAPEACVRCGVSWSL